MTTATLEKMTFVEVKAAPDAAEALGKAYAAQVQLLTDHRYLFVDIVSAFDLDDKSIFTPEQVTVIRRVIAELNR